ncbi:MAG: ABC-2 family transporter protein [Microgenomates group bacterium]
MKYWRTFIFALQTELQYRANLIMWFVVGAIGPLTMLLVWFAILGEKSSIGGYTKGDFVIYYLLMTFGWYIVGGEFSRQIGRAIKNGDINKTLLKPYNIVLGEAVQEQAWKLTSLIVSMPALALVLYVMRDYVVWHSIPGQGWWIATSLLLGAIIFALIQATIGVFAFWVTEIWPFAEMMDVVLNLFGGMLAPIALLPVAVQKISYYLPFRYIFYEPIAMILGNTPNPVEVIWRQSLCIVGLYVIYKLVWNAGIKRYEGIGG